MQIASSGFAPMRRRHSSSGSGLGAHEVAHLLKAGVSEREVRDGVALHERTRLFQDKRPNLGERRAKTQLMGGIVLGAQVARPLDELECPPLSRVM